MSLKRTASLALALVLLAAPAKSFAGGSDRDAHIDYLERAGIVEGDETGNLRLNQPISRAELTKVITAALSAKGEVALAEDAETRYTDISPEHWAKKYIGALSSVNADRPVPILTGYEDGSFRPENETTVAEATKILDVLTTDLSSDEVKNLAWPNGWLRLGEEMGIALSETRPNTSALRGDVFDALYRAYFEERPSEPQDALTRKVDAFNRGTSFNHARYQRELLRLLNAERQKRGLKPLTLSNTLYRGSRMRAKELAAYGSMRIGDKKHVRPDGRPYATAYDYLSYRHPERHIGENLIQYTLPRDREDETIPLITDPAFLARDSYDHWYKSSGHRENMLDPLYTKVNIQLYAAPTSKDSEDAILIGAMALE
ncbi:MAG: S-layer homology domain-containing protein [Peptoniphilus sp.]|nr:S-layer homology domain-containing protein [Peptoniphilus sp.]MDD7363287.1 S-layer homology domain-containing protein [Bacillota bacterium]MDY6045380.1 S-layer homology domain-containing protein [Peptoniphilus sp.]